MATTRENLKGYFNTDDRPTESQFFELIDSSVHLDEDKATTELTQGGADNTKYVTPLTAKISVQTFAPVKTVNGINPDSNGNVVVANVSGTASTITGAIAKTQVTGLVTDLNNKQDLLVSGSNIKTVNGISILGSGNVGFTNFIAAPSSSFNLQDSTVEQNAFPSGCDEIILSSNKTYLFKGKYMITAGTVSHLTSMGWLTSGGLNITSMEYVANSFLGSASNETTATQYSTQISSTAFKKVIVSTSSSAALTVEFEGVIRCTTGGKLVPQISFSVAPGGTNIMKLGSYIQLTEIGDNSVQAVGAVS
ncbi:hypothetical protein FLJC2902T_12730 [Flavobacterium limnosediminis JC2902]|uniref:Uncharacterized protein n=1 Tax=Flavobacterium limnosediminis JC2902 TaxID=1341181 RepID=V6SR83_9FLAO|nr:hypothetical protein [Flavobacterium limnosediminis]ESU28682.1 hypothetical protein FLJC2902T_12730 [Flavobacterium limnosediminis JC2902]